MGPDYSRYGKIKNATLGDGSRNVEDDTGVSRVENIGTRESGGGFCTNCGKELTGADKFCPGCGAPGGVKAATKPPGGKKRWPIIAVSIGAVVVILAIVAVILVLTLGGAPAVKLPHSEAELRQSVSTTENYLNSNGKKMLGDRAKDAPIFSVDANLDVKEHDIEGEQMVLFTNRTKDQLDKIVFRVYANSPSITGKKKGVEVSNATCDGAKVSAALKGSTLTIKFAKKLAPGGSTLVMFSFVEPLPLIKTDISPEETEPEGGFGLFGHTKDNTYNLGYWVPLVASYRDGKWDSREPSPNGDPADFECAFFNVGLSVPENYKVASTGMTTEVKTGGDKRVYGFAAGPARDFYSQASPNYEVKSKTVGETVVSSYYFKKDRKAGVDVVDYGANAIRQFSDHFGPYPYKRFNVVEGPLVGAAAGMEFTGQVLLASSLYEEKPISDIGPPEEFVAAGAGAGYQSQPEEHATFLEDVTAHEACHQWWALGVGNDALDNPWQDESLTNYCTCLYFKWQYGDSEYQFAIQQDLVAGYTYARQDYEIADAAANLPVAKYDDVTQYSMAVYGKGALFFNALNQKMGGAAFEKSLRDYYSDYVFLTATPEDLMNSFKANMKNKGEFDALFKRWMVEKHGDADILPMVQPQEQGMREELEPAA